MKHIRAMPVFWQGWVAVLFSTNMAAIFFLPRVEATVVLVGLGVGAALQMTMFARLGFVRLLGIGHIFWLPMVLWLVSRLGGLDDPLVYRWASAVVLLCSVSLAIDGIDVARYVRGEREPSIRLETGYGRGR